MEASERSGGPGFPFVVQLDEDCASEAQKGYRVRESADDIGAPFDLLFTRSIGFVDQFCHPQRCLLRAEDVRTP